MSVQHELPEEPRCGLCGQPQSQCYMACTETYSDDQFDLNTDNVEKNMQDIADAIPCYLIAVEAAHEAFMYGLSPEQYMEDLHARCPTCNVHWRIYPPDAVHAAPGMYRCVQCKHTHIRPNGPKHWESL